MQHGYVSFHSSGFRSRSCLFSNSTKSIRVYFNFMSKTGLKVVTFEVGFVAQMPKCFSPTLVAALVGMLMVAGATAQMGKGDTCVICLPFLKEYPALWLYSPTNVFA